MKLKKNKPKPGISCTIINMKALLFVLVLFTLSLCVKAEAQTNGFLVFQVERVDWHTNKAQVNQKFKVPLTEEFMAQFKNLPNQHSSGTGFSCFGGELKSDIGSTRFMWWIRRTSDNRWHINMWSGGREIINGLNLSPGNPSISQYVTIKRLEDLDMTYQVSYAKMYDGRTVQFRAKYVSAKEIDADGPIPTARVKKDDGSELFKGDDTGHFPLELVCKFQEG